MAATFEHEPVSSVQAEIPFFFHCNLILQFERDWMYQRVQQQLFEMLKHSSLRKIAASCYSI